MLFDLFLLLGILLFWSNSEYFVDEIERNLIISKQQKSIHYYLAKVLDSIKQSSYVTNQIKNAINFPRIDNDILGHAKLLSKDCQACILNWQTHSNGSVELVFVIENSKIEPTIKFFQSVQLEFLLSESFKETVLVLIHPIGIDV